MNACMLQGESVPPELVGALQDSSSFMTDPSRLQQQLDRDGYIYLRGVLDAAEVLAGREEIFSRLMEVGEIKPPAIEGIATGQSRRQEVVGDLGTFWKSVSEGPALRQVTHGERIQRIMDTVFGQPARGHDLIFLRAATVGRATQPHYDYPFFAGFSPQIHTVWIPLGDVPVTDGPLVMVEGSNRFADLVEPLRQLEFAGGRSEEVVQKAAYEIQNMGCPIALIRERSSRFLTTGFSAGDVVVFTSFTLHGSLDNHSSIGRTRLSCDVRYQPASDTTDDQRYFGHNPSGSKGQGYADMRGAKPLTEPW